MVDHLSGVAILGSTGSVGTQTLDVLTGLRDRFRVVALSAGNSVTLLNQQILEWQPALVYAAGERADAGLNAGAATRATLEEMVTHPDVEIVVVATTGTIGLAPTLAALRAGKAVAIANKEVLVMAGALVRAAAVAGSGELRPVDSEHSAIWQCLWGELPESVAKLLLTASGGAFRDLTPDQLHRVTPEAALHHPTWTMGRKVTIDSATLLNKGLETIEASFLFDLPFDRIEVIMHRESVVHSLVEFVDGAVKAQLGVPDMRLPIQCALTYPERLPVHGTTPLDLARIGSLHFEAPDFSRLPCLRLAIEAGKRGGTYPAVLAAADEVAVDRFLDGTIGFMDIPRVIEATLEAHVTGGEPDLDAILDADRFARDHARSLVATISDAATLSVSRP